MTTAIAIIAITRCQYCGKRFRIDPNPASLPCPPTEYEGRLKRCPACHKLFTVKLEDGRTDHLRSVYRLAGTGNPNWIDDIYAGTRHRRKPVPAPIEPLALPAVVPQARPIGTSISNRIDDI